MSNAPAPTDLAARLKSVHVGVRAELQASRHIMRGQPAYVVRDPVTFHSHRLSSDDYQVFVALNETDELGTIFQRLCDSGRLDEDQEADFYGFVLRLTQLGLLSLPVSDGKALYTRFQRRRAAKTKATITGFLFLRVPLIQPDAFLARTVQWVSPLFTQTAFVLWLIGIAISGLLIAANWHDFSSPLKSMLAIGNLPVLWTLLVGLKVVHEFGHAYACRHFGGCVPEMGAFFIVFTPCAYVDASASWGFPRRLPRIVVALAGIYFESILAMIALAVWALTGPGTLHSAAQYAVVLSTAITIGFNANPLMKYDGYFVLCDLLGMPNLRSDAQQQLTASLKKQFFQVETAGPQRPLGKRLLLIAFGVASSVYKAMVVIGISTMIAFKVPAAGIALAGFYIINTLWQAGSKLIRYLYSSDEIAPTRQRAVAFSAAAAATIALLITCVPIPSSVDTLGFVSRRDDQVIRADATGFLSQVEVAEGVELSAGSPLCQLRNIELASSVERQRSEIAQLQVQLQQELGDDLPAAAATGQRIMQAETALQQLTEDARRLTVRAPIDGVLVEAETLEHLGSYIEKGQPLATISSGPWCVETFVNAETLAEALPKVGQRVQLRLIGGAAETLDGVIIQIDQAGSPLIDQEALTQLAGGDINVSPGNLHADQPFFRITIQVDTSRGGPMQHGLTAAVQLAQMRSTVGQYVYRRALNLWNTLRTMS